MVGRGGIRIEELINVVDLVHMLPAATVVRLEVCRESHIIEDLLPVQGIGQVPERFAGCVRRMVLAWDQGRARHGNTKLLRDGIVEELIVGTPPEWIVDHTDAVEGSKLQHGSVVRYIL